ncbi:hypothetical protein OROGR_012426 [Orobanche gracilis]
MSRIPTAPAQLVHRLCGEVNRDVSRRILGRPIKGAGNDYW